MHEQHGAMRIREHMLYEAIAAVRFRIGEAVERAVAFRVLEAMIQVALLLVAECFAVADEKLKIARIGMIDVRIIDLVDDPMAESEPKPATAVVGRAHALLFAGGPARLDSGRSKRHGMAGWIHQGAHLFYREGHALLRDLRLQYFRSNHARTLLRVFVCVNSSTR